MFFPLSLKQFAAVVNLDPSLLLPGLYTLFPLLFICFQFTSLKLSLGSLLNYKLFHKLL